MAMWWRGTRLVAGRGLVENVRSRLFKIVTGLLLLLSIAAVTLPRMFAGQTTTYTLATVGQAPADVVAALDAAGRAGRFDVRYLTRRSPDEVRTAVRDGRATAGLAGDTLYVSARGAGVFPVVVGQALVGLETSRRLAAAGLSSQEIEDLRSIGPPDQVTVGPVQDEGRAGVGFAVGIVLYLALVVGGTSIATTVATEKSTRISEGLLAVLRPSQILVGTVIAVGTVTLVQLLVLGTPLAIAARIGDGIGPPPAAAGDIALGVMWFLLGFALYAFLYAASGALVDKITEVNMAVLPITMVLVFGYLIAIVTVPAGPASLWSVMASMFPLTAPLAMPLRWASGTVPTYQLAAAMVLAAGTAVALVWFSSVIYRRALLITGRRVRFRDVIGGRAAT